MIHKGKGRALAMPAGFVRAEAAALIITVLISGIIAWLIVTGKMDEDYSGYGVIITLFIASFLSAVYAVKNIKRRIMLVCIVTGLLYWAILLFCTFLFWRSDLYLAGEKGIIILSASVSAAIACTLRKK